MTDEHVPVAGRTWELLTLPSTATLTTVLAKHGLWNVFVTGARPLSPGRRMVGQAVTLRYIPAREDLDHNLVYDNSADPQRLVIEQVGPRDVLVIDARGDGQAGTMGSILATRLVVRGAVGIVTDGALRDSAEIAAMDIPAYARPPHAAMNKTIHHPADFQQPIGCGGVAVFPGDILVGDDEGVVVIPRHLADDVAVAAAEQEHREQFILNKVRNGAPLAGTYPPDEVTQAEYEQYCRKHPKPTDGPDKQDLTFATRHQEIK